MSLVAMTAYDNGRMLGMIAVALLLLAGVVAGIRGGRRPGANRLAHLGLVLVCASGVIGTLVSIWMMGSSSRPPAEGVPLLNSLFTGALSLAALSGGLAGAVCSAIGLAQYYRARDKWKFGALSAGLALVICCLFGGTVILQMAVNLKRSRIGGIPDWSPPEAALVHGDRWVSQNYNYSLGVPGGRWMPTGEKTAQTPAKFGLLRLGSSIGFTCVPERLPPSSLEDGDTAWLFKLVTKRIRNVDPKAQILAESAMGKGGLSGTYFEAAWRGDGQEHFYVFWVAATNGWAYQLIVSGEAANQEAVRKEAKTIFSTFAPVELSRVAPGWETLPGSEFRSSYFPYTVALAGFPWRPLPLLTNEYSPADFRAKAPGGLGLTVLPATLPSNTPPTETVLNALLAETRAGTKGEIRDRSQWTKVGLHGEDMTWTSPDKPEPLQTRIRFIQGDRAALLIIAEGPPATVPLASLNDLLDRVSLEAASPTTDPAVLPRRLAQTQAKIRNNFGLYYYSQNNFSQAANLFHAAGDLWPENEAILDNECDAGLRLGQHSKILTRLQSRPALVGQTPGLQASLALCQWQSGDTNQAAQTYAKLFDRGYEKLGSLASYCNLLFEIGDTNQAVSRSAIFAATNGTVDARLLEARVLIRADQSAQAVKVLEAERERSGLTQVLGTELVASYLGAQDLAGALKTCNDLLGKGYDNATVWYLKGIVEQRQKKYTAAQKDLETAGRLAPNDQSIRAALARVAALLGQGDNFAIKEPIDPVPLPADLGPAPDPLPQPEMEAYGAQYLDRSIAIRFNPGGNRITTERFRVQIYNENGLERFRTLSFEFDSLGRSIYANEITVRDAANKIVATVKPEDCYITDDSRRAAMGMASNRKQLNVPVPGLQAGLILDVTVTWKDAADTDFPWYDEFLERQTPAARLLTVVQGDLGALAWEASPGIKTVRGSDYMAWSREHTPAWVTESFEPAFGGLHPRVSIAGAGVRWAPTITNYLARIADRLGPDAETRAAYLIHAAPDAGRVEQIRALAGYVQTQCSYRAIEFGRHAQVPTRPGETIRHRYGDCKDQAVLLRELLALGGIEAHLALASTTVAVRTNLASLDQFNHMLVYVPALGTADPVYIDTTARAADPFLTPRWALGGSPILILDPKEPRFVTVPGLTPADSIVSVDRQITISDTGELLLTDEVEARGLTAAWLRSLLVGRNGESFRDQAQRFAEPLIPGLQIDLLTCGGIEDSLLPVTVRMKAHARQYFQKAGNQLVGSVPALWEKLWASPGAMPPRRSPLEVRQPWVLQTTNHIQWPPGYTGPATDSLSGQQKGDFILTTARAEGDSGRQILVTECTGLAGSFPAERAAERQQALVDALKLVSPAVVLDKK